MGVERVIWQHRGCQGQCYSSDVTPKWEALLGDTPMPDHESGGAAVQDLGPSYSPPMLSARCVSLGMKFSFRLALASISCFFMQPTCQNTPSTERLGGKSTGHGDKCSASLAQGAHFPLIPWHCS